MILVHSKQHERAGHRFTLKFIQHGSGAAVLSSCGPDCCRVVSVVVYSGFESDIQQVAVCEGELA